MIESTTLGILCALYLIFFRPWKTRKLEKPLVIQRPGQFHLSIAPQLNFTQTFIDALADRIAGAGDALRNTGTHFFEVRDEQLKGQGDDVYLLAVTRREGLLYIQAARPASTDSRSPLQTISEFAHSVLVRFPDDEAHVSGEKIIAAVQQEAEVRGIQIKAL